MTFPLPVQEQTVHHLGSLASAVHRAYFFKYPPICVRWGQQISRKRRRSIRLGSYNHITTEIRIHPLLNTRQIPAFVIESIIHHEYLHHFFGASHGRRFRAQERKYCYYRESQEWIQRNLFRLLGRKRSDFAPASPVLPPPENSALGQLALF